MTNPVTIDTPFGPFHVHVRDDLPEGVAAILYSPPPVTNPEDPSWVPLAQRVAAIVSDPRRSLTPTTDNR